VNEACLGVWDFSLETDIFTCCGVVANELKINTQVEIKEILGMMNSNVAEPMRKLRKASIDRQTVTFVVEFKVGSVLKSIHFVAEPHFL
jgi:DNA-binding transcriptional regulator GbsR (MarR family)